MRIAIGAAVVGLLGATALSGVSFGQAWSSSAPPPPTRGWPDWSLRSTPSPPPEPATRKWVHLNGAADLEHLRTTNFNHYLRAQPILAAANEICRPGSPHVYPTRFKGDDYLSCGGPFLMSYPPKALLRFHLDDVGYIAMVSVTVTGGKMEKLAAHAPTAK
jgi:hypothetical protein